MSRPFAALRSELPAEQRPWHDFLVEYLPPRDARADPELMRENLAYAARVRRATPVGMVVPEDIFLDYVLPHRFIDERWQPWRAMLCERFMDRAHRAASVEDAVFMLNRRVYEELGVEYHPTRRPHNNMSVAESIEAGFASCTGLSILLAAACRAVGIPARLAGVAAWTDGGGNHTWVEVWDHGRWRVVAARESFAYDQTWFNDKARDQTVYALAYRDTGLRFPVPWSSDAVVPAECASGRTARLPPTPSHPIQIEIAPRRHLCPRVDGPLTVTGRMDDPAWDKAEWTEPFVDIEGHRKPSPRFRTRAKTLWDDTYFYVGAMLEDPHVWATLTERNAVIFNDPDFEIFIDPDGDHHNYYEFEINAFGTVWELSLDRPYRDGGPVRRGDNMPGLVSKTHVHGSVNDPTDQDCGWSVEVAIPWAGLRRYAGGMACPPERGDQWKINLSRVHWLFDIVDGQYRKVPREAHPEDNWVWSPQHAIDMHRPECWGWVQFGESGDELRPDPDWPARERLVEIYYRQKARGVPTDDPGALGLSRPDPRLGPAGIRLEPDGWTAQVDVEEEDGAVSRWTIDQAGRFGRVRA